MRSFILTLQILTIVTSAVAQAPSFKWAVGFGNGEIVENHVAADADGNVYTAGSYVGPVDFDPGPGTYTFAGGGQRDVFISKVDSTGNFVWAKTFSGPEQKDLLGVETDASNNVFVVGFFSGTVDFDPGPGIYTMATGSSTLFSTYVAKLDQNGNLLWVKQLGTGPIYSLVGYNPSTDPAGNLVLGGRFSGIQDFDPGPAVSNLNASINPENLFILKLDASGNFVWVKQIFQSFYLSLDVDNASNIFTAGSFSSTCDFDPGPGTFTLTPTYPADVFVMKLDGNGNFLWAKQFYGSLLELTYGVAADCQGNIYTSIVFQGTIDADPGPAVTPYNSFGSNDILISKLDASGNFVWGKRVGGSNSEFARGLDTDLSGNIYFTGQFRGVVDFDPGAAAYTIAAVGNYDFFIEKLSSAGAFEWAYGNGSPDYKFSTEIYLDKSFNVYTTGQYSNTVDFDPFPPVYNLSLPGTYKGFTLRFSQPVPKPTNITPPGGQIFCGSGTATLSATTASGIINWYSSPTATTIIGTGSVFTTPLVSTTTTYFIGSPICGQTPTRIPVTIIINPLPTITLVSSSTIVCEEQTVTLTASGATTYSWSNTKTGSSITVTIIANSNFSVTGTDAYGCVNSGSVSVSLSSCAGLAEQNTAEDRFFRLYPNPCNGEFSVDIGNRTGKVELILQNVIGQELVRQTISSGRNHISSVQLTSGLYYCTLFENGATIGTAKIVSD